ncbi:hypothetical protein [Pseudoroseomonas cervicalis]|uniref:hypothetical protein n=1 Tax=Teichococcus cervicalis TaxID=204525 RepID=UPI002789D8A6|nr:hypothetical protein [Pseudoroseomonas cervicalis]MDQ1080997.1 hypothetical protein [Pseudoroseomonas cervicalis]
MRGEWQRLEQDLRQQPGLRDRLGAALARCDTAEAAAALLRRHGYAVEAGEWPPAGAALPEAALDGVAGGGLWDILNSVAAKAVPFLKAP